MLKDSYKLLEVTNLKEVFPLLAHKDATWDDILEGFDFINDRHRSFRGTIPRHFYIPESFDTLEAMGLDYNHKDECGNQFFHHIMDKFENQRVKDGTRLFGAAILPGLFKKTDNIYETNWGGRHILFNMMTYSMAGAEGEEFKEMLEKYPKFDLHLVDKDGYNALNYFSLAGYDNYQKNLFTNLVKELDISHQTVHKRTCFSDWIEFVCSDRVNKDNKKNPAFWLNFTCKKIIEKDFLYTDNTLNYLLKKLEDNKVKYFSELSSVVSDNDTIKELKTTYTLAIGSIKVMKLEKLLPQKDAQDRPKVKI